MDTFLIDVDFPINPEEDKMEICFLGLASKRDQPLCIMHLQSDGKLDSMYDVRDRLATDLTEKQTQLMEMIIRAEDAIVIGDLCVCSSKSRS
ncbi:unnamed protein product [Angiostrongylus costaricensis]|uniref:Transposase n=1 Tax=Angiostrongylus costaricensis TaxID=334426 RepID=A0A0R3P9P6_ANGCS|nr:unnamed protein product [Angiostrongylus costaricensis]